MLDRPKGYSDKFTLIFNTVGNIEMALALVRFEAVLRNTEGVAR